MSAKNASEGYTDPGDMAYITGWGLSNASSNVPPAVLQKATVPIVSDLTASRVWQSIPVSDIMAGYLNGNKDACSGDSGGPMSVWVDGEYKLAGIVSWGSKNCDTYGGYSCVSYLENWIRSETGIYDFTPSTPVGDYVICAGTISTDYTEELIANALSYEWRVEPENAGTVSWTWEKATVTWNAGYLGNATVKARVKFSDSYSEWAEKQVICAQNTRIVRQPADTSACVGDNLNIILRTEGTNMNYNWYKDGSLFKTGNDYYVSWTGISEQASGTYKCEMTGLCGTLTTRDLNLIVYPLTEIHSISPDVTADYGNDITLSVDASGHDLSYQWLQNGTILPNTDTPDLLIQDADARNIGLYKSIVKGTCGTRISDSTYVFLKGSDAIDAPVISVWPTVVTGEFNVAKNNFEKYEIRIVSTSGKVMKDVTGLSYETTLNISNYPKGIYIVNIRGDKFTKSFKIIKV